MTTALAYACIAAYGLTVALGAFLWAVAWAAQ
jgi:hypothetical protein